MRRIPHPRLFTAHWALWTACALFLLTGAFVFDDYGDWAETGIQRAIGNAALDYLAGDGERAFDQLIYHHDRYYGAVFEAPRVVLLERLLGLESERDIYLGKHLLAHLFFLVGGGFCYLLVLRLFGSRGLALVALVLFLLHPRLYAHSFFNGKDIPFLVAFMIALYLVHRAFRRDTLGAFILCGVGVGLLVNLRIMGVLLFAAVLVLRALDLAFAGGAEARRRALLTGGGFALAAVLTFHASLPALWTDPVGRFAELARTLGAHPLVAHNLFRGEWLYSMDGPPFDYLPVWVGLTTPPAVLLLAFIGAAALAWRGLRRPRELLRDGPLRFGLLLAALPVATTAAIVVLESNVYHDWRQLYFLYAPLLLLAAFGLHGVMVVARGRWPRVGAYALAGGTIAVALVSMVRIHPYEDNHFTLLTDRTTPERPESRYEMDYWGQYVRPVLTGILRNRPSGAIFVSPSSAFAQLQIRALPPHERERIVVTKDFRSGDHNFYEAHHIRGACSPSAPVAHVYRDGRALTYLRDGCTDEEADARFFLHVVPADDGDLPEHRREYGFENLDFTLAARGARIDGNCVAVVPLPDYPVATIRTGQYDGTGALWTAEFAFPGGE